MSESMEALAQQIRAAQLPPIRERRRIRLAAGVTLREAAATLDVTPMTVLRWERGQISPRRDHTIAYRRLLDVLNEATQ